MIDPAPCVRNKEENMMNNRAGGYMATIRAELKAEEYITYTTSKEELTTDLSGRDTSNPPKSNPRRIRVTTTPIIF